MATLTKSTGTVTLSGAAEKVTLPASYGWVWVKNMSEGDIFAGVSADISEGSDGVMTIPAGECGRIQADGFNSVYLLGSGNVQIVGQNYADCPFKAAAKGGGSGGSGGGLTLLGTYEIPSNTQITLGTTEDIPEGTKLMFERIPTEYFTNAYTSLNGNNSYLRYFGYVPFLSNGYDKSTSGFWYNSISGSDDKYMQISRTSTNDIYVFTDGTSNTWNIYKVEV